MEGDRGVGDRDKRGREVYRRREKRGWEEGEIGKNYATLRNIWRLIIYRGRLRKPAFACPAQMLTPPQQSRLAFSYNLS